MKISLEISGKFFQAIKKVDSRKRLFEGLRNASTYMMQRSIENAPKSTGAGAQSMRRELNEGSLTASIFPTTKYMYYLHGPGSEGQSKPRWIPAREAKEGGSLYRWAKKKGMNPWAIRASIAKKGTKYNPWLKRTAESEKSAVVAIMKQTIQSFANFFKQ